MVATRLHIKIIDFGIARLLHDNSPRLTLPSQAIGTLAYISPEQLGGVDVDGRADLYSLGCVMYELLAGRPPFMAEVPTALLRMQLQERAVPLDSIRPDLPAGLSALVDAMMEKDRAQRPADAAQVLRHIQAINAGMGQVAPEQEADRQTISRVTSIGGPATEGAPAQRPFAPEADRATVFAADVLGRQQQPTAEAGRGTQLTPERLEELSGPAGPGGPAYPGYGGGYPGTGRPGSGGTGYPGTGPDYGQPPTQHPGTSPAGQYPATQHPGTQEVGGPAWPDAVKARTKRRKPRWRGLVSTLITLVIVGGIGFYVWHRSQQQPLKVSSVSVAPVSAPRNCAATVDVVGTIVTNGKGGPVTYQWTQNGSAQKAATVTDATGQDAVQVTLRWAFHGKGTTQALAELQVLTPTSAVGNTQFTYSCK
jgi:hypothetical protein